MKLKSKLITVSIVELIILLVLPMVFVNTAKPHEFMGVMMLSFFLINPITAVIVNLFVGKDVKKLWWMPISFAVLFLLSYWIVLREIIWDLMVYAIVYVLLGFVAMVISWIVKRK